eukprot:COSAG02_NODE_48208_length_335_cov_0.915254_1_plen_48_part_10
MGFFLLFSVHFDGYWSSFVSSGAGTMVFDTRRLRACQMMVLLHGHCKR